MKYSFQSLFADRINKFIEQKNALGFPYKVSIETLSRFDRFCLSRFPCETDLSKEICMAWATKRDTENNNGFYNRVIPIREFARYLIGTGEYAYIVPSGLIPRDTRYVPYIYSEHEILAFWNELDKAKSRKDYPAQQVILPVIFKLIYCCGLRPSEALNLRVKDVDLTNGKLYIMESKGHKDRIVMTADDVSALLHEYIGKVSVVAPKSEFFFPGPQGGANGADWLRSQFRRVWGKTGISHSGKNHPRVYDFRHTFATHRLYRWMREGKDLTAMIPYLSAYMGHSLLSATYYYIHLVPGQLALMSGFDFSKSESLLPEVEDDE